MNRTISVEKGMAVEEEYLQSRKHREEKGEQKLPDNWLCRFDTLQKALNQYNCAAFCALEPKTGENGKLQKSFATLQ